MPYLLLLVWPGLGSFLPEASYCVERNWRLAQTDRDVVRGKVVSECFKLPKYFTWIHRLKP